MDKLPAELITHLACFLDNQALTNIILASKKYSLALTACLYDRAIEYINPREKLIVDLDLWAADIPSLPAPWLGYTFKMVECAKHWQSAAIIDYFSKTPLHIVMSPYMDEIWSIFSVGETLLHQFVTTDNMTLTRLLLDRGVEVDKRTCRLKSPLHYAIQHSNMRMVQLLLDYGADVLAQTDRMESAVAFATSSSDVNLINLVMDTVKAAGGDIFAADINGNTPLHRAAVEGNLLALELLLQYGADLMKENVSGCIPLHVAVLSSKFDAITFLIGSMESMGCNLSAVNTKGETALHLACCQDRPDVAKFLGRKGVDMLTKDQNGKTALAIALNGRLKQTIRMLLDEYPTIWAPLDLSNEFRAAVTEFDLVSLHLFLDLMKAKKVPLNINSQNHQGDTVLHGICVSGQKHLQSCLGVVQKMLHVGADAGIQNYHHKRTPIHVFLTASVAGVQSPAYHEIFQSLLNASANIGAKDHEGNTLLHCAAAKGDIETVRAILLTRSSHDMARTKNKKGYTPLHCTIGALHSERVIRLLISSGANINCQGKDGRTALHLAAGIGGDISSLNLLIQNGANVLLLCNSGNPPIHFAAEAGWDEAVGLLFNAGSDPHGGCYNCRQRIAPWKLQGEGRQKALEKLKATDEDCGSFMFAFLD